MTLQSDLVKLHAAHTSKMEAITREHEASQRRLQGELDDNRRRLHTLEQNLKVKEQE